MRNDDLLSLTRARPFVPFRIYMNSGNSYEVRHPELADVGRSTVNVYLPPEPGRKIDKFVMLSILLIAEIEYLDD